MTATPQHHGCDCGTLLLQKKRLVAVCVQAVLSQHMGRHAQVYEHAAQVGGKVDTLAVGGDSSGGNFAAAVSLMAKDKGSPRIRFQLLVSPVST